jgi:S1-C subfamily serine protease
MADFIMFPQNAEVPPEPALRVELGAGENSLMVTGFLHGSPAKAAGIKTGDYIEAVDGKNVKDLDSLKASLAVRQAGDRIRITVKRGSSHHDFDVDLGHLDMQHPAINP